MPFDSPGIIAYYTVVRTGSRNEVEKGLSGFAHFFEHMMFRGTERYPQEKYNDVLKALGADSNAFTTDDWTCYHITVPATALAKVVEIEADRFRNLKYDEPAFQKEARAVLGEYNKSASSPFLLLNETMQDTAYTTHTYKHTTIGFLADVKDMPNQYAYSKTFFDRWYRPENCTIVVAGDVDHDQLVELVRKRLRRLAAGHGVGDDPRRAGADRAAVGAADLAGADPADRLPRLPHPGGRPRQPRHRRPRRPGAGGLRRDEPALSCRSSSRSRRSSSWRPTPSRSATRACSRSSRGCASPRTSPRCGKRIESTLAEAASSPIDAARLTAIKDHLRYAFAGSLDSADAVAHGRRPVDRHHRPPRRDERPLRRLRPPDPRRPPARRRRATSPRPTRRS